MTIEMTRAATESFPYTIHYATELLGVNESELMSYAQLLGMTPSRDAQKQPVLTGAQVETLKKAMEMKKSGEDIASIVRRLKPETSQSTDSGSLAVRSAALSGAGYATAPVASRKDNITGMVEAVSQLKDGILKDLSRLLDDKLSGLDEVVVELIRCKSENDSLRKQLEASSRTQEQLEYELSRFKPVQFGFFRKL